MSTSELKRVGVMERVKAGTLKLGSAAELLGISYRQAKRVYRRYRAEGAKGLKHRSAGRRSNRATAPKTRTRALALVREKYSGAIDERFGPTLAAEHLASEDGLVIDHETLRRWMLAEGLWSRARKRSPHRRRRVRKAHFGELVQLDGSFHPWFEARGSESCLLTLVDDATGQRLGRFSTQETIWAAVAVLRAWIGAYGIPQALYTDWKNVYVRPPTEEERLTDAEPLTQFGRMCAQLGIRIIPASSPQAKGRIERNHGTHQDRLVKKLRRQGIADIDAANAFLEAAYWPDHNQRFARPPASPDDFHVPVPRGVRLDTVFRLEDTRTVSNDWVVRYANRYFQLERQSHQPPARAMVQLSEGGRWPDRDSLSRPRDALPGAVGRASIIPGITWWRSMKPGNSWRRRGVRGSGCNHEQAPMEAAGPVDAKSARPQVLGKPESGFPRASTGITFIHQGTFLSS